MENKYMYIIKMNRWGSDENHSYIVGVYTSLRKAIREGKKQSQGRSGKYEPMIYSCKLDASFTSRILCRNLEETEELINQLYGRKK